MIPNRYLIATLFIAALLLLAAIVQAPRSPRSGGVAAPAQASALSLEGFEITAEYRMEEGWAPRFRGTQDPDQPEPWPYEGGFGAPWEPASPYLGDQGLALNGPGDRSEVVLWRGLEWRHYRFDVPLVSARIHPGRPNRLLVTLQIGPRSFETRMMEVPEGRVLWSTDSGPWSRFSWDGKAVLLGLQDPREPERLLLSALPVDGEPPPATLATWDEKGLPPPPKGWTLQAEQLWDDGKDLPGARVLVPFPAGSRLWMPARDRLWTRSGNAWILWRLDGGEWRREATGAGALDAHPPVAMVLLRPEGEGAQRLASAPAQADWVLEPAETRPWPAYDPAWAWRTEAWALNPWDLRWNEPAPPLPKEGQRPALVARFRGDWRAALGLRASLKGWLPAGPEIALREPLGVAWAWVGDRAILVKLPETERLRLLKRFPGLH